MRLKQIFGANVRALRRAKGWSQTTFGDRVDMSANGVSKMERGATATSFGRAERIAEVFEVPVTALFSPEPPIAPTPERARRVQALTARIARLEAKELTAVEKAVRIALE
ncbi:MAG: helix-turn-helix domain-containing protein [Salinarimonas sp.]